MIVTVAELDENLQVIGTAATITVTEGSLSRESADLRYVRTVNGDGPDVDGNVDVAGGGGTVESVNGVEPVAGDITLTASDVGADAAGAAATAQAAAVQRANHTGSQAIATVTGLQTALDGKETAGAAAAAQAASQPLDADLTTVAALDSGTAGALVTDGSGWIRKTYAQLKTALSLVKADVGLGSVDNTSDAGKPVSTAQQTALDLKANLASPALTGNPTAPTQTAGNNSTRLASTAFVTAAVAAGGGGGSGVGASFIPVAPHMLYPDTSVGSWSVSVAGSALPYYVNGGVQNDELVWLLPIAAGTYDIRAMVFRDTNRGIATVAIDDGAGSYTTAGTMDNYGASAVGIALSISGAVVTGAATTRRIRFKMATKNGSSGTYYMCLHNFTIIRTA